MQIIVVQLLQFLGFVMAVQTLADLQSQDLQRMGGRASPGTMRTNNQDRRSHSLGADGARHFAKNAGISVRKLFERIFSFD